MAPIAVIRGKCSVTLIAHFEAKWSCFNPWRILLVLFQCDNYGFSVPVVFRSKAQCAGKTQSIRCAHGASFGRTLAKHCNVAAGHHRDALRVSLSTPTDCVAPLAKGVAIACEARLAVNVDKLTELAIITLKEH